MRFNLDFYKWKIKLIWNLQNFNFMVIKKPTTDIKGITSRCSDLKHVIFLEWDFIERWLVEDEIRLLQKRFNLTPFYLFLTYEEKSKVNGKPFGNYCAICITKRPIWEVYDILKTTQSDWKYKEMWRLSRYKAFVLRFTKKGDRPMPRYVGLMGGMENLDNEISSPHLKILEQLYDVDFVDYKNPDNLKETYITSYKTSSHLNVREE